MKDAKWLAANVFDANVFDMKLGSKKFVLAADGTVSAMYDVDDLAFVLDSKNNKKFIESVLTYDGAERWFEYSGEPDYDLPAAVTAGFDERMKPRGISWETVKKVAKGVAYDLDSAVADTIEEMLDNDFANGNSYSTCYSDVYESGSLAEARDDILTQLGEIGVKDCE